MRFLKPRVSTAVLTATIILSSTSLVPAQKSGMVKPIDLPDSMTPVYAEQDRQLEDLQAHGIGTSEDQLIEFLKNGLPRTTGLPERPAEKSQLIIDAMAKLSAMKSRAAVPVLMQIARFDTQIGAFRIVEYDVNNTSPQSRDEFRVRAYRLVQYNAINALGLIGDRSATELIRSILQQEQAAGAQIQYAICLANLGDPSGVGYLVNLVNLQNRRESAAAAKAFYYITGQDFGYTEHSPIRARQALSGHYAQWWNQNHSTFRPDPEAIAQRRRTPNQLSISNARSTRDLLKVAANYFDFNNTLGAANARQKIKDSGTGLNKEFERIASDPIEDLDVRIEAMNWYFEGNRSDPLDLLKKLRRDENPEIVDKANTLLEQIEDEARMRGGI